MKDEIGLGRDVIRMGASFVLLVVGHVRRREPELVPTKDAARQSARLAEDAVATTDAWLKALDAGGK